MAYPGYNMTAFAASGNPYEMFAAVNTASGSILGGLVLMTLFIVILLSSILRQNAPAESFFFASLASAITSLIMLYLDLSSIVWVVGFSFILAMSAIGLYQSRG